MSGDIAPVREDIEEKQVKASESNMHENDIEYQKLQKKKEAAWAELGELPEYISKRAEELYKELQGMKKGARVSRELGYILDNAFNGVDTKSENYEEIKDTIYKEITDALLNLQAKPGGNKTKAERFIKKSIERDYEWKYAEIDEMQLDKQAKTRSELRKKLLDGNKELFEKALDNAKNISRLKMNNTDTVRVYGDGIRQRVCRQG